MAGGGGVIHDGSTTGPKHDRDLVLHQQQHAADVNIADLMVVLDRLLGDEQAELALGAGVVEGDVQRPEGADEAARLVASSVMGEDSLERVTAAAEERQLSQNSLLAYRRTWLKIIAWAAAEGLVLETFPVERVGEFYEEATRGRSASHHLQVKAALALLYHVLGSPNPFAECLAPKFAPEKTELRYHTSSQLGQLLRELRKDKASYFGHLTYHLATALFFTGCRYHELALLTMDRLVREPGGVIIAARLQVKGASFRDVPLTRELSDSLGGWFAFLESVKGVRLRLRIL